VQESKHPASPFSVREATQEDLDFLVAFTLAEAREAEKLELDPRSAAAGVRAALLEAGVARYWVLEDREHKAVGSISAVKEWSDWRGGFYWWVQSLFIEPPFRGQGLARVLLEAVKGAARAEGALDLRLYVHQDNLRAIRAYEREGFRQAPYKIMRLGLE
jgi:GNAT superfamily N-acetyltransferase